MSRWWFQLTWMLRRDRRAQDGGVLRILAYSRDVDEVLYGTQEDRLGMMSRRLWLSLPVAR